MSRICFDDVLRRPALGDALIHALPFDIALGVSLRHAQTFDQQPFGPVHKADLFDLVLHALLLLLHAPKPLPLGAEHTQALTHEGAGAGHGERHHPVLHHAGVDAVIELGLDKGIFCFNVESIPELEVINEIAASKGKVATVCFRINPNVGAHTHANITTGLAENKFGIDMQDMEKVIRLAQGMKNVQFKGLHFHIGSQILEMDDFIALANRINELQDKLEATGVHIEIINVGGGLGVDYDNPQGNPIPNFKDYFAVYDKYLKLRPGQTVHFELGRAVVAQCGALITKVNYVKENAIKKFAIVDAGFTDLIRPALYDAHHRIINLCSSEAEETYDVVGPICESSDTFDKGIRLPKTHRGDLIALLSAGAYGEIMASSYNCRRLPEGYTSDELL